jgi:hypothetical protein
VEHFLTLTNILLMLEKGKVEWLEGQNEALTKKVQKQLLNLQQSTEKIWLLQ